MLHIIALTGPEDQKTVFADFDPLQSSWIVSDLKSKLDLARGLLAQREFVPGDAVLRASELWKVLLSRLRPDFQVISKEFAITLISQYLTQVELAWAQSPGVAQTAYGYMTQLMPLLAHTQGDELIKEWFEKNQPSLVRWKHWYELAATLWQRFLKDGFVAAPWISGVLVNEPGLEKVWSRDLIVDLGAELNQVEADLLMSLSAFLNVTVLKPSPIWQDEYERTFLAYGLFEKKLQVKKSFLSSQGLGSMQRPGPIYKKFTTMIAEVKDAVVQIRTWLEAKAGVLEPFQIAVVAPDIEIYWPALSAHLQEEGIPFQKNIVRRLHSFPDIAQWLADLRLKSGSFSEADLEVSLYETNKAERLLSYEKFKVLFTRIYDRGDLSRHAEIEKLYATELAGNETVRRDDFVVWALKNLPENANVDRCEQIFRRFFAECPDGLSLQVQRWLNYLMQLAARLECRVADGDPEGIAVINLISAENSPVTHMIILGLTETALKESSETGILFSDVQSLAREFGFHLPSADQARSEFAARWVIENSRREMLLFVPETNFGGAVEAASWLWVKGAREAGSYEQICVPRQTRWDELQRASRKDLAVVRGWSEPHLQLLGDSIERDLGLAPLPHFAASRPLSVSPSGLEDYLKCPFIFAAKRLFKLSDLPNLDLDVDASTQGSLMHALFERLCVEPMRFEYSAEELGEVIDLARTRAEVQLADERLWPALRRRYFELAQRFLTYEREWRKNFPQTKTLGREVKVQGFLQVETGELVASGSAGGDVLEFRGRLDRVDADASGKMVLIDYKSSANGLSQYTSWLENNRLQLLLYALALENGLTELPKATVLSAVFYVSRTMNREYGFKVSDVEQNLYSVEDKRRNKLTANDKERLITQLKEKVRDVVAEIKTGFFAPRPMDTSLCHTCEWSALCRAPHLNT